MLSVYFVILLDMQVTLFAFCRWVIVNEKSLNFEKMTSSVLSVLYPLKIEIKIFIYLYGIYSSIQYLFIFTVSIHLYGIY